MSNFAFILSACICGMPTLGHGLFCDSHIFSIPFIWLQTQKHFLLCLPFAAVILCQNHYSSLWYLWWKESLPVIRRPSVQCHWVVTHSLCSNSKTLHLSRWILLPLNPSSTCPVPEIAIISAQQHEKKAKQSTIKNCLLQFLILQEMQYYKQKIDCLFYIFNFLTLYIWADKTCEEVITVVGHMVQFHRVVRTFSSFQDRC
jgi:hypothetical protein